MAEPLRTFSMRCRDLHVEMDMFFSDAVDEPTRIIFRQLQKTLNTVEQEITEIREYLKVTATHIVQRAYQFAQITAAMLESSDDPDGNPIADSVLTTESATEYEFNWKRAGGLRNYKVILGPGDGVPSHFALIDLDDVNYGIRRYGASAGDIVDKRSNVCRPYGMAGVKLQFGYVYAVGNELKFMPTSLGVGTWVYLEQELPMVTL